MLNVAGSQNASENGALVVQQNASVDNPSVGVNQNNILQTNWKKCHLFIVKIHVLTWISTDADRDEYGRLLSKLYFIKTSNNLKEVI